MPAALEISSLQKTYANGFEALKGIDLNVREVTSTHYSAPMAPVNRQPSALSVRWSLSLVGKFESAVSISMKIFHWQKSR